MIIRSDKKQLLFINNISIKRYFNSTIKSMDGANYIFSTETMCVFTMCVFLHAANLESHRRKQNKKNKTKNRTKNKTKNARHKSRDQSRDLLEVKNKNKLFPWNCHVVCGVSLPQTTCVYLFPDAARVFFFLGLEPPYPQRRTTAFLQPRRIRRLFKENPCSYWRNRSG